MAISISTDVQLTQSKHRRLAAILREAIVNGTLKPGEKLPSARDLAILHQINRHTVMNALQNLVSEGWLVAEQRKGYCVNSDLPITASHKTTAPIENVLEKKIKANFATVLTAVKSPNVFEYQYNFASGMPDIEAFPFAEFRRCLSQACRTTHVQHLHYAEVSGIERLQIQIKEYVRKARNLACEQLLICNGSQEALTLVASAFINPGDGIAMEALGYPPARKAFQRVGARVHAIEQDDKGIKVEALANCLKENNIKLLYLTPLHQYPTSVTLAVPRRMAIYQLCQQYGVFIIEDDYDHEFHYTSPPLQPMAATDPSGIVIYVSTFSKIMFAGARVGYLTARSDVMQQLIAHKQLLNHKNEVLTQLALAIWMEQGGFERHLRRVTKSYAARYKHTERLLIEQQKSMDVCFNTPQGGMAFWIDCKKDVGNLTVLAKSQSIYVQTEPEFCIEPKSWNTHIRLGFASQNEQKQQAGIEHLFKIIKEMK
ncbi:PLP-dependent aminotransferase family protein (plasmid) [Pseudoalteromonas sp. T1lg65]|uniref:MocR-like pyridoxine biosynthesis transcription factor PdxR n=1 Tax=Pseudoalteromonas sp. T1lg65 TaxID=2077101 RepID=UPI003F7AB1F8